ncbi:MAG: fumarylacetoacetate hydrolase family protein [Spirochaetales bacterium]|nr:fumarylacetoacetate hydrolase family protein [Spirochaetales bacterium]
MIELPVAGTRETCRLNPSKIIALGLNYRDHIADEVMKDMNGHTREQPKEPVLFAMTPNVLIGPGEEIVIPAFLDDYGFDELRIDYEGELALIIKDRCRNLRPEEVYGHILGFTCFNDVSCRNIQKTDPSGWFRGKSLDTFGPAGPEIVPLERLGDPQALDIETRVNGAAVQKSNTAMMLFTIPELVSFISRQFTLEAGDLISTGTPGGVGPLHPGDIVEVEISGIGTLVNGVRKEKG